MLNAKKRQESERDRKYGLASRTKIHTQERDNISCLCLVQKEAILKRDHIKKSHIKKRRLLARLTRSFALQSLPAVSKMMLGSVARLKRLGRISLATNNKSLSFKFSLFTLFHAPPAYTISSFIFLFLLPLPLPLLEGLNTVNHPTLCIRKKFIPRLKSLKFLFIATNLVRSIKQQSLTDLRIGTSVCKTVWRRIIFTAISSSFLFYKKLEPSPPLPPSQPQLSTSPIADTTIVCLVAAAAAVYFTYIYTHTIYALAFSKPWRCLLPKCWGKDRHIYRCRSSRYTPV